MAADEDMYIFDDLSANGIDVPAFPAIGLSLPAAGAGKEAEAAGIPIVSKISHRCVVCTSKGRAVGVCSTCGRG